MNTWLLLRWLWFLALAGCGNGSGGGGDASGDGWRGNDAGVAGVVSCYTEGNPTATCTLPTHCCFDNFSAQHNGSCSSSACAWATLECDGPEDCPQAQRCCARRLVDPSNGTTGYVLACQAAACATDELCHPTSVSEAGTCSSGGECVSALGAQNDLPRTLFVCR